jgi:uncharacterized protein (DUF342 family)
MNENEEEARDRAEPRQQESASEEATPVEPVSDGAGGGTDGAEGGPASSEVLDFSKSLSFKSSGDRNDGSVEISVTEDGMEARADFFPPLGEGLPIGLEYVHELLRRLGVVHGVLSDQIADAALQCNLDRKVLRSVEVAAGQRPTTEIPEHACLESRFTKAARIVPEEQQRVDFKEYGGLLVVKKGETLATIAPAIRGSPGMDVRGRETPFQRQATDSVQAGKNVERREDRLVALADGRLERNGNRLDVDEVLVVKGAVDYHTGHIVFPGDVIIEGPVKDGFKVWSGGSIVCKSTMDAFDVNAKKDITCSQGIIGKRNAQIRVGGTLSAKFIQNCRVAARGDIKVATAIVNSRVYALGRVDLGDKGVLMGGETYAVHGLRCGRLGNQARQRTMIHVGTDFTVQQRLDAVNEKIRLLSNRARQIDASAQSHPGPEAERAKAEVAKAAAALRAQVNDLLSKLDADDGAMVEVRGEILPGVVIEICRVRIGVDERMGPCGLRLDKAAGRIIVEKK